MMQVDNVHGGVLGNIKRVSAAKSAAGAANGVGFGDGGAVGGGMAGGGGGGVIGNKYRSKVSGVGGLGGAGAGGGLGGGGYGGGAAGYGGGGAGQFGEAVMGLELDVGVKPISKVKPIGGYRSVHVGGRTFVCVYVLFIPTIHA